MLKIYNQLEQISFIVGTPVGIYLPKIINGSTKQCVESVES